MRQKKNNKGFSLVELIVVIAIMIVLVAVLAPVFTKYVEQSRRATDVTNANSIAEAVLVDAADGTLENESSYTKDATNNTISGTVSKGKPSGIASDPVTKGNAVSKGATFTFVYHTDTNTCDIYVTGDTEKTYNLTNEQAATNYKNK